MPFSAHLHTDVMGIACFDSDYLYLNLINADESADAWIGIGTGKDMGITRRNNLTMWKKKVTDYSAFSYAVKNRYACAEEFLSEAESCLDLPARQASVSMNYLKYASLHQNLELLYFRREEGPCAAGPDLQICSLRYAEPCFDGRKNHVLFLNCGDEFCGLSVYFLGPYVENEEITFSDVRLGYIRQLSFDLNLKKIQLDDGQWAYYCHIPDIQMEPGVRGRMSAEKRYLLEQERERKLSFVPHGNPHKMLDITVMIVPDGKPENQAIWNVWQQHGSKEAFIKYHNKSWKQLRNFVDPDECLPYLKIEDFAD